MKIRKPERNLARLLVADLIARDPRLMLNGDMVELDADGFENRELAATEFVVFDLETTGTKAPPCRITEIGAYRVKNGRGMEKFVGKRVERIMIHYGSWSRLDFEALLV